jgi:putative tricarboxylic transport membrane protein
MKQADRQLNKTDKKLRPQYFMPLYVAIFLLLFIMVVDSRAADLSADYPSRTIEYVVHNAPGTQVDVMARLVTDIIQKEKILNQPPVVINKVGGGGAVAAGYVMERKGNPYIVLSGTITTIITTPMISDIPYSYKSFTPIANLVRDGSVLVVKSDSPFKTVDDIIDEARKRPKELIQGGASAGSNEDLMGRSIQKLKGVQWKFIPFAGGEREAILNVLSGNLHFAFAGPSNVYDHVRAGKLRVLAAAVPERFLLYKDVPTFKEAGLGDPRIALNYRGVLGPPDMPEYAVKKLEAVFKKVANSDRFKKFVEDSAMQSAWMSPHEYGQFLEAETTQWKGVLSEYGLLKKKMP